METKVPRDKALLHSLYWEGGLSLRKIGALYGTDHGTVRVAFRALGIPRRSQKKHGLYALPENACWRAIRSRCHNPGNQNFADYGARGITVCERWDSFEVFLADVGRRPSERHSLGRINNDLGYSPTNCRWETPGEQQRNTRKSKWWHINGQIFDCSLDAAIHFSVPVSRIQSWVIQSKPGCYTEPKYPAAQRIAAAA